MAKIIRVFPDRRPQKKDNWNWSVTEPSRQKKGKMNVLYSAQGFDTKQIAKRRADAHNRTLIKKLPIVVEALK